MIEDARIKDVTIKDMALQGERNRFVWRGEEQGLFCWWQDTVNTSGV